MGATGINAPNKIDYLDFSRGQDRIDHANTEKNYTIIDQAETLKELIIKAKQDINQEERSGKHKDLHQKLDMSMDKIKTGLEKIKENTSDFYQLKKIEQIQEEIDLFKKFDEVSRNLNERWAMTGAYAPMGIPSDVYLNSKKQEEAKEFLIKTAPKFGLEGKFEKYDIGYDKFAYYKTNTDGVYSHSGDVWKVDRMKQEQEQSYAVIGATGPEGPQKESHPYRESAPKFVGSFAAAPVGWTGVAWRDSEVTEIRGVTGATGTPGLNYYKKENMEQIINNKMNKYHSNTKINDLLIKNENRAIKEDYIKYGILKDTTFDLIEIVFKDNTVNMGIIELEDSYIRENYIILMTSNTCNQETFEKNQSFEFVRINTDFIKTVRVAKTYKK
jgi:hypothetical protein